MDKIHQQLSSNRLSKEISRSIIFIKFSVKIFTASQLVKSLHILFKCLAKVKLKQLELVNNLTITQNYINMLITLKKIRFIKQIPNIWYMSTN